MRINNHIKSAAGNLSQHKQLSHDSLITNDFGQICPVLAMPLLPRDKFSISASCFSRVAPMIFPTYGRARIVTNFHSVQYSQVWRDFDIFVSGQLYRGTVRTNFPVVSSTSFGNYFSLPECSFSGDASADNHDLVIYGADNSVSYRFLTSKGRYIRKVLVGLGYPFISFVDNRATSNPNATKPVIFSALPLLSYIKVYSDYYESRQYSTTSQIREFLRQAYNGSTGSYWIAGSAIDGQNTIEAQGLANIFDSLLLLYPSDYFTSAASSANIVGGSFPVPEIPSSSYTVTSQKDKVSIFYSQNTVYQTSSGNAFNSAYLPDKSTDQPNGYVRQFSSSHRVLENLENLVRRFNLVGAREIDRIRAMFGVRPAVQRNQYSQFHGGFSSPLQVQDVTSTSANFSDDNYLGSYAGKGIVSNGGRVSIDSDDFGFLIGLSFIQVSPLYQPGLNREVLKTNMWSYYNPDFDHGYAQALSLGEVQSNTLSGDTPSQSLLSVFGYQTAYDEYRQCVSRVNGDFIDVDLHPWTFLRDKVGIAAQTNNVIYQAAPNGATDGSPYNDFQRIFVDGSNRDHFYLFYSFDISALRVVRTSSESFDLGVGNVSTSNNPVL